MEIVFIFKCCLAFSTTVVIILLCVFVCRKVKKRLDIQNASIGAVATEKEQESSREKNLFSQV